MFTTEDREARAPLTVGLSRLVSVAIPGVAKAAHEWSSVVPGVEVKQGQEHRLCLPGLSSMLLLAIGQINSNRNEV